ncbi:MAG: glycosyltransferase family 4 protein [Candidatus Nealsonbacteria bacterium]
MKIIFATGIFPPDIGGPATYVERLATDLHRQGFNVGVITYSDNKGKEYNFQIKRISRKWPFFLRYFIYFFALLKLAINYDVVYAQNLTSAGLPALLISKLTGKRFVLKIVGDAAWEQKKNYLKGIQKFVAKNANKIITPSYYLKDLVSSWEVPKEKIKVVYNAPKTVTKLNLSKVEAKEKIGIKGDIILSVGRLSSWKGFPDLIAIMPDLLEENSSFKLLIVGEGEEKEKLRFQILRLGLENKVKLTGVIAHSEMPFYFKAADVFVLNSGYEGLSHVILEAMQLETPIVASSKGGNPELLQNNFNGFLVEYKNQKEIKTAILNIWRDKNLQEKFKQNSKEKLKDFTWENLIRETLKVLKK